MSERPHTPLLDSISSPEDLRRLPVERLPELCSEIRRFLIASLSDNPGHFASSMGSVELTVALHYVFDTPRDRLVWDVGHQAYAHKLLTGRARLSPVTAARTASADSRTREKAITTPFPPDMHPTPYRRRWEWR